MIIGNRYSLPHGTGVFLGYEVFPTVNGTETTEITDVIPLDYAARRAFELDPGHTWGFNGVYFTWAKDVKELDDVALQE